MRTPLCDGWLTIGTGPSPSSRLHLRPGPHIVRRVDTEWAYPGDARRRDNREAKTSRRPGSRKGTYFPDSRDHRRENLRVHTLCSTH